MDFIEFVREKSRMCCSFSKCDNCPLHRFDCDSIPESDDIDKASAMQKKVKKWAEENPIKTNADKFKEVFGVTWMESIISTGIAIDSNNLDIGFWNEPYEGKE